MESDAIVEQLIHLRCVAWFWFGLFVACVIPLCIRLGMRLVVVCVVVSFPATVFGQQGGTWYTIEGEAVTFGWHFDQFVNECHIVVAHEDNGQIYDLFRADGFHLRECTECRARALGGTEPKHIRDCDPCRFDPYPCCGVKCPPPYWCENGKCVDSFGDEVPPYGDAPPDNPPEDPPPEDPPEDPPTEEGGNDPEPEPEEGPEDKDAEDDPGGEEPDEPETPPAKNCPCGFVADGPECVIQDGYDLSLCYGGLSRTYEVPETDNPSWDFDPTFPKTRSALNDALTDSGLANPNFNQAACEACVVNGTGNCETVCNKWVENSPAGAMKGDGNVASDYCFDFGMFTLPLSQMHSSLKDIEIEFAFLDVPGPLKTTFDCMLYGIRVFIIWWVTFNYGVAYFHRLGTKLT